MKPNTSMTDRFQRPGLLSAVSRTAVIDGTAKVIMNTLMHANGRLAGQRGTGAEDETSTSLTPRG